MINTTVILTSHNPEDTLHTPSRSPAVVDNPIIQVGGGIMTPTNDLNGMAAQKRTSSVLVDTGGVRHEILVDFHGTFHWTISHDSSLNVLISIALHPQVSKEPSYSHHNDNDN